MTSDALSSRLANAAVTAVLNGDTLTALETLGLNTLTVEERAAVNDPHMMLMTSLALANTCTFLVRYLGDKFGREPGDLWSSIMLELANEAT